MKEGWGEVRKRNFSEAIHLKEIIKIKIRRREIVASFLSPYGLQNYRKQIFSTPNYFIFLTYRFVPISIFHSSSPYKSGRAYS